MTKFKTMILVAVVALSGAFATGAQAADKAPTKVTIKADGGGFYGKVKSSDPYNCSEGREVIVYRMEGHKPKPKHDTPYLSDTASLNGQKYTWSTGNSGVYEGHFYAKVKKTQYCKGAKSKVVMAQN